MKLSNTEYIKEENYFKRTTKIINEKLLLLESNIKDQKKDIYETKKYIWEECQGLSELELSAVRTSSEFKVNQIDNKITKYYNYQRMLNNPYFGRIDFETDNSKSNIYIGINGLSDDNNNYIYDWRAPISSLFYDYSIGKASYLAPIGEITGEISLRRQYKIENGKIERIIENDINIDDEILQEILNNSSSDKMQNIVTTIQKEQNQVIRNTNDKVLVVQGVAGSGKTSVALHRIAYLLYKEENLKNNNVLIFSPNDVFSEYISNVLPELGEENVLNTTFNDLVSSYLNKKYHIESFSKFLERVYENKKTLRFNYTKEDLDIFLKDYYKNRVFKNSFKINSTNFNSFELNNLLISKYKNLPFMERLNRITDYLLKTSKSKKNQKNKIYKYLINECGIDKDITHIYELFLNSKDIDRNIQKEILYEDLAGIMYIYFEINGYPYNTNIRHMVIDEAQDYTKLQYYILKKIFPYASFTILGDINQSINPYCNYQKLDELKDVFNNLNYLELTKTYRSSAEIIEYSNKILNIKDIKSVRGNNGHEILIKDSDKDIINDIKNMKADNLQTIAIITKNDKESKKIYQKLSNDSKYNIVLKTIEKNSISVLPSYIAKGLEFDGVIAYNADNYTEDEKKLFYVVCTRAQHELIIYK